MKKRSMAFSTIGYITLALLMFVVLTVIYFGHTGFFQKIYKITDKLGFTKFGKAIQDIEQNITEGREKLTPEQQRAEELVRSVMGPMVADIENCLKGTGCVCTVNMPAIPKNYVMRFENAQGKVYVSVFEVKERSWISTDYDENYQGKTGVHLVYGAIHEINTTQVCVVTNLDEEVWGDDVDEIDIKRPAASMVQVYWNGDEYYATEATGSNWLYNSENDYRLYGGHGAGARKIYKTGDRRFCFFGERWGWDDDELIDNIVCGEGETFE